MQDAHCEQGAHKQKPPSAIFLLQHPNRRPYRQQQKKRHQTFPISDRKKYQASRNEPY